MKEIKKVLFLLPSYVYVICSFIFFIFKNFVEEYKITKFTMNEHDFIILLFMLMCISFITFFIEIIYSLYHVSKTKKLKKNEKYIWIILLCLLNIISLPYYGLKYIFKDKNSKLNVIIYYSITLISFILSFIIIKNILK